MRQEEAEHAVRALMLTLGIDAAFADSEAEADVITDFADTVAEAYKRTIAKDATGTMSLMVVLAMQSGWRTGRASMACEAAEVDPLFKPDLN